MPTLLADGRNGPVRAAPQTGATGRPARRRNPSRATAAYASRRLGPFAAVRNPGARTSMNPSPLAATSRIAPAVSR
jgi:hypothetical protein